MRLSDYFAKTSPLMVTLCQRSSMDSTRALPPSWQQLRRRLSETKLAMSWASNVCLLTIILKILSVVSKTLLCCINIYFIVICLQAVSIIQYSFTISLQAHMFHKSFHNQTILYTGPYLRGFTGSSPKWWLKIFSTYLFQLATTILSPLKEQKHCHQKRFLASKYPQMRLPRTPLEKLTVLHQTL